MYCNKVKNGKHCIAYTLQLNPCSGCFTACMSVHLAIVKLGYVDQMKHCDMVPNGVADSIKFQLTPLHETEVLACSFHTYFNYGLF